MEYYDWESNINSVFEELTHLSTLFVHMAGSDQIDWIARRGDLINEQNLINPLRVIRQWAALIPYLSADSDTLGESIHQLHMHSITHLTNFLDVLLLSFYRNGQFSSQWSVLTVEEQKQLVLSLSICLQCLYNLLSASKTLGQSIPFKLLQALLSVLTAGQRTRLLLGQSSSFPPFIMDSGLSDRVLSYAGILFYSVLLHLDSLHNGLELDALKLIADKLIVDPVVFQSIISHATQISNDESAGAQSPLHYRLLLLGLADACSANESQKVYTFGSDDVQSCETKFERCIHATGLVLLFRSSDLMLVSSPDDLDVAELQLKPQTIRPCMTFYRLTIARCSPPRDFLSRLLIVFDFQCIKWIEALLRLMAANPSESSVLHPDNTESAFPFALLRGVVHLLSDSLFPDPSNLERPALLLENSLDDKKSAEQLWDRICDTMIMLNNSSQWLDRLFSSPVQPVQRQSVNGSTCTVYPSLMTRKWPSLPPGSPLSLCQTAGFQHDCLRCMAGLISTFPHLAFSLACHSSQFQIPDAVSQMNVQTRKSAFQCILEATNRDSANPLSSEWAILLIRLALNPKSTDEKALEGAKLLSAELTNLQLIR